MNVIYNKNLEISETDIDRTNDIDLLKSWKDSIVIENMKLKIFTEDHNDKGNTKKAKACDRYRRLQVILIKKIDQRLRVLKQADTIQLLRLEIVDLKAKLIEIDPNSVMEVDAAREMATNWKL